MVNKLPEFVLITITVILAGLFLTITPVHPSPFLVCDPQPGVTFYKIVGPAWVTTSNITAQADGSLRYDISAATVGSNSLSVVACKRDNLWGEVCSTPSPFTFTRPGLLVDAPNAVRLVP
jgi:hypothetical protein